MKRAQALIDSLGGHKKHEKKDSSKVSTEKQLTLYELGALIVVAGTEAGFDVLSETKIEVVNKTKARKARSGKFDCLWCLKGSPEEVIVAWEIDAQDVAKSHLRGSKGAKGRIGNELKFKKTKAKIKIQALYSIRGELLPPRKDALIVFPPQRQDVQVLTDTELMSGKLKAIVREASKCL